MEEYTIPKREDLEAGRAVGEAVPVTGPHGDDDLDVSHADSGSELGMPETSEEPERDVESDVDETDGIGDDDDDERSL